MRFAPCNSIATCSARFFPIAGSSTIVWPFDSRTEPRYPTISISRAFSRARELQDLRQHPCVVEGDEAVKGVRNHELPG